MGDTRTPAALAVTLFLLLAATDAAADEALCHVDIVAASEALQRSHEALINECLKNTSWCPSTNFHVQASENALRARLTKAGGACDQAVNVDGVPLSSFGPGPLCRDAGGSTSCEDAVPAIATLDDLAECLVCLQRSIIDETDERIAAYNRFMHPNKARCIRSLFSTAAKSARAGRRAVAKCAKGGTQPFACPVDDAPDGRLGKSLAKIEKRVARCRDEADVPGQLSTLTMKDLCVDGPLTTNAELSKCYADSVRCTTCLFSNRVLGQAQDCAAFSGVACQGTVVEPGMLYVANTGDDTVTFYGSNGSPINGTAAASSFTAGAGVSGVAANPHTNLLYVANADDDTVTFLDAKTGAPALGTLAASTFAVGDEPIALDVAHNGFAAPLFILNAGDETVTILHSRTGKPWNGDLASSTFAVGADPRDLAVAGVVLVSNHGDDTVTALAKNGSGYLNGTFAASTHAVGDGPTLITRVSESTSSTDAVFVVNANDDTITRIDDSTGVPAATTPAAGVPVGIALGGSMAGVSEPVWTTTGAGDLVVYNRDGSFVMTTEANATFPIGGAPSILIFNDETDSVHALLPATNEVATFPADLAAHSSVAFPCSSDTPHDMELDSVNDRLYVLCKGTPRVVVLDAAAPGYAFGSAAASTFAIPYAVRDIEVDGTAGVLYASAIDAALDSLIVLRLDATTLELLGASPYVIGPTQATGIKIALGLDPGLGLLYLADPDNEAIVYLDATTLDFAGGSAAAATLVVGTVVDDLAVDPAGAVYAIDDSTDTIVYADATAVDYLGPDLPGSTLATQDAPSDVAANSSAGLVYTTSSTADVVTFFDAATVSYAFGSLANSTFDVEQGGLLDVDPIANRLYVGKSSTNGSVRTATILDATTGAYVNGTLEQSVFPWVTAGGMVANPNQALVLSYSPAFAFPDRHLMYYDGLTGAPLVWGPDVTSQATGPSPVALEVMQRP